MQEILRFAQDDNPSPCRELMDSSLEMVAPQGLFHACDSALVFTFFRIALRISPENGPTKLQ